jgi:hypothetical protein
LKPAKINCDAARPDGNRCGERALILQVHYEYVRGMDDQGAQLHVLSRASYDIHCPCCGRRTQVRSFDDG